jgi:2,3-dihydroxybiphenyl 1,2-dioxygenase
MSKVDRLGYIGIGARDLGEWSAFATDVLGHETAPDSDAQNLYLRMDDHHHRLVLHPSDTEDVAYVGWQVADGAAMDALAARLDAADVAVIAGKPEEAAVRRVLDFVHFVDPHSGTRMEIAYGPEMIFNPPFAPRRPISGFKTGDQGLGHFVTTVPDVDAAARFYGDVLGFAVTDWLVIPGMGKLGAFMHCNARHHSLAFFAHPGAQRRVHHVMLEQASIDDVGTAYDLCLEREVVTATLGRHLNDRMISFYFKNPSGWHLELGWGARDIDPATWNVEHYNGMQPHMGEWGHDGLLNLMA